MWNEHLLESLKLIASIGTPVAIAFSGILINRTIQRQNASTQMQSSWRVTWAENFLKVSASFSAAATNYVMAFWWHKDFVKDGELDISLLWREFMRCQWELSKFIAFAPVNGKNLEDATNALVDEGQSWAKNRDGKVGGDIQQFRQKQLAFNMNARKVHAELLGLKSGQD